MPEIAPGVGFTVIVVVLKHPVDARVYDMVAEPAVIPVATPVEDPIEAIATLLLLHMPPGVALERVV